MSLETAYNAVEKLVNDFKANERHYLAADYSESQARLDFIDKLFISLGWDVNHDHQKNPYEQEVKIERRVRDKETQKRADYAFFLAPNYRDPKFYVEAKKPSRSLSNPYDYFQAIRYGWNAGTPLVVLTDFEEFHILDSRFKPDIRYTKERKVLSFHYTEYTDKEKFAKLYYLFSREAVGDGSIDKFAETMPKPRGKAVQKGLFPGSYQSIDESFLEELDDIRNTLARSFKKKNPALTSEELTEATQRTIDRLVFIRFLEDMLIEGEHHISTYGNKGTAWGDFIADCRSLNAKYNGIVFKEHFIDHLPPSKGGSAIAPDDKDFAEICEDLSHVNSPYNFNSIPIHILGSIYERFLGKVVHATDKRVTIEEKPEVRKAGGVYYTPQYIVQYIVNNTVGKLIEGKTPAEISKLRFADISCGSGSFLITVYDTLLRYHSSYYQKHPKEAKADGCILSSGLWVLSLKQKRQILINNVFGVDIDHQAVEVTQLSLYLKLLEDETLATANEMQAMFKEKILPDLSKNIICGNSLIGTDIYDGNMFPGEEERKINAMNFEDAFPAIMKNGGFDAIVGNPPYFSLDIINATEKNYLEKKFLEFATRQSNIYFFFLSVASKILKQKGLISYINERYYFNSKNAAKFRKYLQDKFTILQIVDFKNVQIFKNVNTLTVINTFEKGGNQKKINIIQFKPEVQKINNNEILDHDNIDFFDSDAESLSPDDWVFSNSILHDFKSKLDIHPKLDEFVHMGQGLTSGLNDVFIVNEENVRKYKLEKELLKKYIKTRDIKPYLISYRKLYLILTLQDTMIDAYPNIKKYLHEFKSELIKRYEFKNNQSNWYAISVPRNLNLFQTAKEKILTPLYSKGNKFGFDNCDKNANYYVLTDTYLLVKKEIPISLKYLLGLLNSKLLNFFNSNFGKLKRDGYFEYSRNTLTRFPIRDINFDNNDEKKMHDDLVSYVDQILISKFKLSESITDKDLVFYESKCNSLERQIDRLVYQLYGLTEEEIKIVEGE